MNNERTEVLELLLDRATADRDRLAVEHRRSDDAAQRARLQAEQLAAYRSEYVERWSSQFGRGGAIEIVHCYRSFMQRLDEAVGQQQQHVDNAERALAQAQALLLDAEMRVASVRKLIERRRHEAAREAGRREQRQTDETSQQLALRRARGGMAALQH